LLGRSAEVSGTVLSRMKVGIEGMVGKLTLARTLPPICKTARKRLLSQWLKNTAQTTEEREMQMQSVFVLDLTLATCPRSCIVIKIVCEASFGLERRIILLFHSSYNIESYTATGEGRPSNRASQKIFP
jgi:glycyl-tRNA synthetase (class II)